MHAFNTNIITKSNNFIQTLLGNFIDLPKDKLYISNDKVPGPSVSVPVSSFPSKTISPEKRFDSPWNVSGYDNHSVDTLRQSLVNSTDFQGQNSNISNVVANLNTINTIEEAYKPIWGAIPYPTQNDWTPSGSRPTTPEPIPTPTIQNSPTPTLTIPGPPSDPIWNKPEDPTWNGLADSRNYIYNNNEKSDKELQTDSVNFRKDILNNKKTVINDMKNNLQSNTNNVITNSFIDMINQEYQSAGISTEPKLTIETTPSAAIQQNFINYNTINNQSLIYFLVSISVVYIIVNMCKRIRIDTKVLYICICLFISIIIILNL